jgi:class 3 adenylate cyclase/tetratricopeptide (TPR) repeat protein
MQSITGWLELVGLSEYANLFIENNIDVDVLRDLTDQDLEAIGVSFGHRKKILRAIVALREPARRSSQFPLPELPRDEAQRRQLTMIFCDLVGSTRLSLQFDPEELSELISAYQAVCSSVISTYDGFIARFIGDGVLAYFGYPAAHEDDAERAVRAGLEIAAAMQRITNRSGTKLEVRIGIATGLVVVGDLIDRSPSEKQLAVGETPNLAARLQSLADPGSVVIAASTRRLLGDLFSVRDIGSHEIKGVSQSVQAWVVEGLSASEIRFEAVHPVHLTGFVGREDEVRLLLDCKNLAWKGEGQMVLISGEAGIGKSRLAVELGECVASEAHTRVRYQCSPYHSSSALYPFTAQLERAAEIKPDDPPERRLDKLEAVLATGTAPVSAVAPLFAALLAIPFGGRYPPLALSPEQQRSQILAAILDRLDGLARQRPILCIFEDMHWADATSLELLKLVAERLPRLPILMLITSRPGHEPPWTGLPNVSTLGLGRLDRPHVQMIVQQVTGGRALPADVMDQIVTKTDGVPLFVEELTKTVLETGILVEGSDGYQLERPLPLLAIPATLHDSLMARLDRLPPVKEIAQIAAAIGREFSYDLLSAVSGRDEPALNEALAQLEEAELVFRSGEPPVATYSFKHALVRDTAYDSLLKSRRQILHRRIAETLRDRFPATAASEPAVVAHHFTQGGLAGTAAEWWGKAGEQAQGRAAYVEAAAHLTTALHLAEQLTEGPAQRSLRLRVLVAYANVLMVSKGYHAPETVAAFAQASELAARVEEAAERYSIYYGLWTSSYVRGQLRPMKEQAENFRRDVERGPASLAAAMAFRMSGASCWFEGDYIGARSHLLRAKDVFESIPDNKQPDLFLLDVGVPILLFLAVVQWPLGNVEEAQRFANEAMTRAQESDHPHSLNYAHFHKFLFDMVRGDFEEAIPHAHSFYDRVRKQGLQQGLPWSTFIHGWSLWREGDREAGEAVMREGLALIAEQEIGVYFPLIASMRAEIEAEADVAAGVARLDQLLAENQRTGQHWFDAELHRQRGELLLRLAPADITAAEADFTRAMEIARSQQTKMFELRARISLAKCRRAAS